MRGWILCGMLAVMGCGSEVPRNGDNNEQTSGETRGQQVAGDADLEKVRKWLRQNLESGRWEEVRWWPARPMVKEYNDSIEHHKNQIAGYKQRLTEFLNEPPEPVDPERPPLAPYQSRAKTRAGIEQSIERWEQYFQSVQASGPRRAARLRYRTANKYGALELHDDVFYIHEDSAEPAYFSDFRFTAILLEHGDFPD